MSRLLTEEEFFALLERGNRHKFVKHKIPKPSRQGKRVVIDEQIEADEDVANLNYLNGKRDGIEEGFNKAVEWIEANTTEDEHGFRSFNNTSEWQAFLKGEK